MSIFGKMKKLGLNSQVRRAFQGHSRGFTLIEVLIALALFSIIAITFLGGLTTASMAVLTADVRATAENLARAQMEYVKSKVYSPPPWDYEVTHFGRSRTYDEDGDLRPTWWDVNNPPLLSAEYTSYTVQVEAEALDESDSPIQEITVTVSHEGRVIFTLEGYKRNPEI